MSNKVATICRACGSRTVPHCPATNHSCSWWQCARCYTFGAENDSRFVRNDALRPVELTEGHNQ